MTTTTPTTLPEPKYRRLDMAQLPPYSLERIPNDELSKILPGWRNCFSPIRFKNTWNYEKEAQEAADKQKANLAETRVRRTQTKSTKMRRKFCKFCMQRGFPLAVCKTHYTKSSPEFGSKITCPALLQQQCARCGENGHTPKYCKSEHWLNTDPRQVSSYRDPLSMDWFNVLDLEDERIHLWQKPIPPALQERHKQYEKKNVKPSRIWIEMTGDHKHYTNDFRLVMLVQSKDDWFDIRPRTEYENRVQEHYEWMRTVMWSETPQKNCDNFFIVNSPPPTYDEASAAAELLQAFTARSVAATEDSTTTAGGEHLASIICRLPEKFRTEFQDNCAQTMRNIIDKYMEHQRM
jgi:hypothetical protein